MTEAVTRIRSRALPYREQRKAFVAMLANRHDLKPGDVSDQGNPSSGIIENRHGVGVLAGGW